MLKDNPFRVALRAEIPVLQDKTRVTIYHPTFWNAFNHLIPETANGVPEQVVWSDFIARRIFDATPEQQGVVLNGPVHQGGPATQGLQQLSQSSEDRPIWVSSPVSSRFSTHRSPWEVCLSYSCPSSRFSNSQLCRPANWGSSALRTTCGSQLRRLSRLKCLQLLPEVPRRI
jgi:hypothetical protein